MACAESVILAFRTLWKTTDAVLRAILTKSLATTCYNLVSIGLMSHIEDKFVLGSIINIMETDNKFDRSETWSEMARIHRAAIDHILTNLCTKLAKLIHIQLLDILRRIYSAKYFVLIVFHCSTFTDLRRYKKNATFAKIITTR